MSVLLVLSFILISGACFSEQAVPNLQPHLGESDNTNCTCVPFYLCKNGKINTDGDGIIDIRIREGSCKSLEVCCSKEEQTNIPLTTTPPSVKPPKGCGFRHPNGVSFKITGDKENESQFGEFPWMVAIVGDGRYQCGGALIHPNAVITAAHCVANKERQYKIRAGEWDAHTNNEPYPHQDRDVKSITIHPQYYAGALFNDIAFLVLEAPVKLTDHVNVICLPPQKFYGNAGLCYATGWGKDVFGKKGRYQSILKKIDLPQVPRDVCQEKLRTTRLGKDFELHNSFICAGAELGKDTCRGDGGSPLVCPVEGQLNRYYQAGIVAWGIGCGEKGIPGVYVNVAIFRDWIDEQMKLNDIEVSSYEY